MVDWLYAQDATSPMRQLPRSQMLSDPRRATWLAAPFSENDLDATAGWLSRHGLVDGVMSWGTEGPVLLHLTEGGTTCAEDFGSDTARFTASRQPNEASLAINRSAGAQVGSGNVQVNHFHGNRPDM